VQWATKPHPIPGHVHFTQKCQKKTYIFCLHNTNNNLQETWASEARGGENLHLAFGARVGRLRGVATLPRRSREPSPTCTWSNGGRRRVGVSGTPSHTRSKGGWARSGVSALHLGRGGSSTAAPHCRLRVETASDLKRGERCHVRVG
jgi:hypothetical protein